MKTAIFYLCVIATTVCADDITTVSGTKYLNATITRVELDGISVSYADGLAKIPFSDLPPELQKKYGYDPAKLATALKQQADALQQQQQAAAIATKKAAIDQIKQNLHTKI